MRALVQPLPEDAQPNLPCCHVFHQVEHIVVGEKVRGLECGGLHPLAERVAVLKRHAQQVSRASDRARRGFEEQQSVGIGRRV